MKRSILIFVFCFFLSGVTAFAQDTIITVLGNEMIVNVDKISLEEVHYYKYGYTDGPKYIMLINEVFMIKLSSGVRYVYPANLNQTTQEQTSKLPEFNRTEWYRMGATHAEAHHSGTEAFLISGLLSLVAPIISLPIIIYYGVANPKVRVDNIPEPEYVKNPDYKEGYQRKAKNKNFFNSVLGTLAGLSPYIILFMILLQY